MLDSIATLAGAFCFLDIVLAGGLSRRLRPSFEPQRTTTTTNNQASSGSCQPLNSDLPTFSQTAVPPSAATLGADNTEGPKVDHVNTTPSTAGSGVERCSAPINLKALESVADCGLSILASASASESLVEEDNGNDTKPEDPEDVADCGQSDLNPAPKSKPFNGADGGKGSTTGAERGSAHVKTEELEDVADCGFSNLNPAPASEPFIGEDNGRVSSMEVGRCPGTAPATTEAIGDVADCGSSILRPELDSEPFFGEGSSEGSTMGVERRGCSAPANIEALRGVADCGPPTLRPVPASEPYYGEGNGMGHANFTVPSSSGAPSSLDADVRGAVEVASAKPGPSGNGDSQAAVEDKNKAKPPKSWYSSTSCSDDWENPHSATFLHGVMDDALKEAKEEREAAGALGVEEGERVACLQGHLTRNDFRGQWAQEGFGKGAPEVRIIKHLGRGAFGTAFLAERLKPLPKRTTHVPKVKGDDNGEGEDEDEDDSDDDNGGAVLREGGPSKHSGRGDTDVNEAHTPAKCVLKVSPNGEHNDQWATECLSLELLRGSPDVIGLRSVEWNGMFLFMLLDYAEHGDLWDLAHQRVFTDGERFALAANLVNGVDRAHRRGLVHKDIKPENVLVTSGVPANGKIPNGGNLVAKLADFGLAVVGTKPGDILPRAHWWGGTPGYMAPELVAHQECTSAVDIWALGPTFLLLFQPEDIHEILRHEFEKVGGGNTGIGKGNGNGNGNGNNNGLDDTEGQGKAHDTKGKGKARDDQPAGDDIKDDDAPQEGGDIEDIRRALRDFVAHRAAAGPTPNWFRGDAWDTPVGNFFRDLIYRVCDPDPAARPTAEFLASYIPRGVAFARPPPSLSSSPSSSSVVSPAQSPSRVPSPFLPSHVSSASPSASQVEAFFATPAPEPATATPTPPPTTATANATAHVHAGDTTIASATASPPPTSTSLSASPRPVFPSPSPASSARPVSRPSPSPSPPASPATPVASPPFRVATPATSVASSGVPSPVATPGSPVINADATPTSSTASAPATSTAPAPAPTPTTPPTPAPGSPTPRAPVVAQALPAEVVAALAAANATAAALANANAAAAQANAAAAHANAVAAEANAAAFKANAEAEAANSAAAAALAVANAANAAAANAIAAAANATTRAAAPVPVTVPEVVVQAPPDSPTGTAPTSHEPTRLSIGPSAASFATKDTSPWHSATPAATPIIRAQHSVCRAATHPRLPPSRLAALRSNSLPPAHRFANPSPRLPLNPRQGRLRRLLLPRLLNLAVYAGAPANPSAEAVVNTPKSANASPGTTNAAETGTEPPVLDAAIPIVPGEQLALSPRTTTSPRGESQDDDLGHTIQGQGTGSCEQEQPTSSPPQPQPLTPRGEDGDEDEGQDALATTLEGEAIAGTGGRRRLTWRRGSKMAARVKGIIRRSTIKARSGNVSSGDGQGSDGGNVHSATATATTTAAVGSGQASGTATTGMAPGSATTATPATPKATRGRPWQRLSAVATRLRGPWVR